MLRLKLFGRINRIVDSRKARRAAAAEMALEAVRNDNVRCRAVHLCEPIANLRLWYRGAVWMKNLDNLRLKIGIEYAPHKCKEANAPFDVG